MLFLDEVGEMSPAAQAKLLRVLQEKEFQRLGGSRVLRADVRVVAATNRGLRAAVEERSFREDPYYRLPIGGPSHVPQVQASDASVLTAADLAEFEREMVERALSQARYKSDAARALGLTRKQLYGRLRRFGLASS